MQRRMWILLASVLVTSWCAFGNSDPGTEWTITSGADAAGTYSYAGGTSDLFGSGIAVASVEGLSTPKPGTSGQSFTILDGLLNFQSGAPTASWLWGPGGPGTLKVTGCIESAPNSNTCIAGENTSTVLVSDEFTTVGVASIGGIMELQFGNLTGNLNPTVAAFFGIPTAFVSIPGLGGDDNSISGLPATVGAKFGGMSGPTVKSTGGEFTLASVPEGSILFSSLGLLTFGAIVLGLWRRLGFVKSVQF